MFSAKSTSILFEKRGQENGDKIIADRRGRKMSRRCLLKIFILLTVGAVAVSSADGSAECEQKKMEMELEEVLSIGSFDDDLLYQWVDVAVDWKGFIYVADSFDYSLKKFNQQGKLLKKSGRRGQGPGEFMSPRLLDISDDCLYVTDQILPGIQMFDTDLNFVARIPIEQPISDMKVWGTDQILVLPFVSSGPSRIYIYDREGRAKLALTNQVESSGMLMDHFSFDCDAEMNIYLAYSFQDKIEMYDAQGEKIWEKALRAGKKVKTKTVSGYTLPVEIVYKDVVLDRRGNIFVLAGSFSDHPGCDIYVLDSQGLLMAMVTLPHPSHCISIDDKDYLYSRADAGVTLKKYKIHYSSHFH
jgi:hypothetical protein